MATQKLSTRDRLVRAIRSLGFDIDKAVNHQEYRVKELYQRFQRYSSEPSPAEWEDFDQELAYLSALKMMQQYKVFPFAG